MFETQKIDSFFSGEKNLFETEEKIFLTRRMKIVRFFKLFLPCLTALLLGVGVILFDFEANSDTALSLKEDEKVYFEKFRMKNTVFEITEKDNRLSTLKASVVEEIEPDTKVYTLQMPFAHILDKDTIIQASANQGSYNQNTQVLNLSEHVVADYNEEMTVTTEEVSYNFETEIGEGSRQIIGKGIKGYFKADKFLFNKKQKYIKLLDHVYLKSDIWELRSPYEAELFLDENKFISKAANIKRGDDTFYSDALTVYFKDSKSFEILQASGQGNVEIHSNDKVITAKRGEYDAAKSLVQMFDDVRIVDQSGYTASGDYGVFDNTKKLLTLSGNVIITDKNGYVAKAPHGIYDMTEKTLSLENNVQITKGSNVARAPKAIYFQAKNEFHLRDGVHIEQQGGVVEAKTGIYYIKKNIAELHDNVVITKDKNQIHGDKAIADFTTSQSRIIAKNGGRIFGKLLESSFKKEAKDK